MSKSIASTLLLLLTFVLIGCGGGSNNSDNNSSAASTDKSASASLNWVAPTTRTDGTPLPMSEIAGYKIYMGSSATNLTLVTDIPDAYTMEHEITDLDDGTHYFAVSAYSTENIESDKSEVVNKTI